MSDLQQNATLKKRPRWAKAFLDQLSETGNVRLACETVGIERSTAYRLKERDPSFAVEWEEAQEQAADLLEQEARRRAYEGNLEPVFGRVARDTDGQIGEIRKYSDTLLIFLLKAARPDKYRERRDVRHSGPTGGPIEIDVSARVDAEAELAEWRKQQQESLSSISSVMLTPPTS